MANIRSLLSHGGDRGVSIRALAIAFTLTTLLVTAAVASNGKSPVIVNVAEGHA